MPDLSVCPSCRSGLVAVGDEERRCGTCDVVYRRDGGIWDFVVHERRASARSFTEHYSSIRRSEGRAVLDAAALRALPFHDKSGLRPHEWFIRSRSFGALLEHVIEPLELARARPLSILDLGSGVGWLACRLALRGHDLAAVDLVVDDVGLGAHRHCPSRICAVRADFDALPFGDAAVDVVVYNASLHYSGDCAQTLREGLRTLARGGRIAILDTPIYRDPSSGASMMRDLSRAHARLDGGAPGCEAGRPSEGFVTYQRLATLEELLGVRWTLHEPWYGLRWWLKPWIARVRGQREPARFKLVAGGRVGEP
jgi:SAM-dependent methyltransferase